MIHLDTSKIGQVDQKSLEEKIEESNKIHVSYVCVCNEYKKINLFEGPS